MNIQLTPTTVVDQVISASSRLEDVIKKYYWLQKKYRFDLTGIKPEEHKELLSDTRDLNPVNLPVNVINSIKYPFSYSEVPVEDFVDTPIHFNDRRAMAFENLVNDPRFIEIRDVYHSVYETVSKAEPLFAYCALNCPISEDRYFYDFGATSVHDAILTIMRRVISSKEQIDYLSNPDSFSKKVDYSKLSEKQKEAYDSASAKASKAILDFLNPILISATEEDMVPLHPNIAAMLRHERMKLIALRGEGVLNEDKREGFHEFMPVYSFNGLSIKFTNTEYSIIQSVQRAGNSIKIEDLKRTVWKQKSVKKNTIKTHVDNIRRKLQDTSLSLKMTDEYIEILK